MVIQTISPGTRGHFLPLAPFDTLYDFNKAWTCASVRELKEMVTGGDDPFNNIYAPAGLTEADFFKDVNDGVLVYVLRSDGEEWIQIPSSYISEIPNTTGVEYRNYSIVVSLGGIPTTFDFEVLMKDMESIARDSLGVDANVSLVPTSDKYYVPYDEHQTYENARDNNITHRKSFRALYLEALNKINALSAQVGSLECYVAKQDCSLVNRPYDADDFVFLRINWTRHGSHTPIEAFYIQK